MIQQSMTFVLPYDQALRSTQMIEHLHSFDPHVVGTLPLGLGVPGSDIDIVCHAPDLAAFAETVWRYFRETDRFALYQWSAGKRPVVAKLTAHGWPFEIFGSIEPVHDQAGWRHFVVEQRLLGLGGQLLRSAVMAARRRGLKTEPAFAEVLKLPGDPYEALLALHERADAALIEVLEQGSNL